MKKTISILIFVCILFASFSCFAANKYPFGKFPSQTSTDATKSSSGDITILVNDSSPWTAYATLDGLKTNDAWIGDDTYACDVYSKSRVKGDPSSIRDIDYIYARVRCYDTRTTTLVTQSSASDSNSSDVSTSVSGIMGQDSYIIFYGTHQYRESGYVDIELQTTDTVF